MNAAVSNMSNDFTHAEIMVVYQLLHEDLFVFVALLFVYTNVNSHCEEKLNRRGMTTFNLTMPPDLSEST